MYTPLYCYKIYLGLMYIKCDEMTHLSYVLLLFCSIMMSVNSSVSLSEDNVVSFFLFAVPSE